MFGGNSSGFCIECAVDEVGEIIGEITNDPEKPVGRFEGYAEEGATSKKIINNVFKSGDSWFRSGDLMRKDALGYYYFIDRIGDTYRWKGENVATNEVSEALTGFGSFLETNIYGVPVPGFEGRAGMAALVMEDPAKLDLAAFRAYLAQHLPEYARPVFLRFQHHLDITGTFKQKKVDLVQDGFNPDVVKDALYFNDAQRGQFVRIDTALYQKIIAGEVRL